MTSLVLYARLAGNVAGGERWSGLTREVGFMPMAVGCLVDNFCIASSWSLSITKGVHGSIIDISADDRILNIVH